MYQHYIPNQVGRFDDSFNINCVGDYFTAQNTPTILFEAGHFKEDYERDEVRKFIFISLLAAFSDADENVVVNVDLEKYLNMLNVKQLRALCKKYDIKSRGNKNDLVRSIINGQS